MFPEPLFLTPGGLAARGGTASTLQCGHSAPWVPGGGGSMPPPWVWGAAGDPDLLAAGAVAVCPHFPLSMVPELGSPNRGHHSTKQIPLLWTLGNNPRGQRDPSVTSGMFISRRGEEHGLSLSPPAQLPRRWAPLVWGRTRYGLGC